jgi:putative two-component system response regulator
MRFALRVATPQARVPQGETDHEMELAPTPRMVQAHIERALSDGSVLREVRRREAKIFVVDAVPENVAALQAVLYAGGYTRLRSAPDLYRATTMAHEWQPDLVILDLALPHRGGFDVLGRLRRAAGKKEVPLLALSGDSTDRRCGRIADVLGLSARDFLARPFDGWSVCERVRSLLEASWARASRHERGEWLQLKVRERARELERSSVEMRESQAEVIVHMALAAEMHDPETGEHTRRVGLAAALLSRGLGLPEREVELLQRAAPLHDIGKIALPDSLLLKPGKLSLEEWEEMKTHCRIGAQVLARGHADLIQVAQRIALFHHEHWDGSGYPLGLKGEEIPLEARILAVADVFDALVHERPYKRAWPIDEAVHEIKKQSGHHFDPRVVAAFMELPHETLL